MKGTIKKFSIKNVKIGVKITLLVALGILGMSLIGGAGYRAMRKASNDIDQMYNTRLQAILLLSDELNTMRKLQSRSLERIASPEDEQIVKDIDSLTAKYNETWPQYTELVSSVPAMNEKLTKTEKDWETFTKFVNEIDTLVAKGKKYTALELYQNSKATLIHDLIVDLEELQAAAQDSASVLNADIQKNNKNESIFILVCIVTCLAALSILSYLIIRAINKSLKDMITDIEDMKNGDFRIKGEKVDRMDEFGQVANSIYDMRASLNTLMSDVHASATQLAASSEELSASSEQSAQASTQVAASTENVVTSVEKQHNAVNSSSETVKNVLASVEQIKLQSERVAKNSQEASLEAAKGNEEIAKSVQQIKQVEEIVEETALLVDKLGKRSEEIGKIVDTISSISKETNLLALNAAIEASHAGNYGKGFNVVASEVRDLANESAKSAAQIESLIKAIQDDTRSVVESMNAGKEAVIKGSAGVQNLTGVFSNINDLVDNVSNQISEVSESISGMSEGMSRISADVDSIENYGVNVSNDMNEVSAATQQQSASAQELAAASESLASLAQDQQLSLSSFKF